MTHDEFAAKIINVVADLLDLDPKMILPDSNLALELGCDSLDAVVIAQQLEEDFKIEISDAELEKVRTVAELIALVEGKVEARK